MTTDLYTLNVSLGADIERRYKALGALRGVEINNRFGEFSVPVAYHQVLTFFAGEYWRPRKSADFSLNNCRFWIAMIDPDAEFKRLALAEWFPFWIEGHLDVLAQGNGKTTSLRLLKWWLEWETSIPRRIELARHLGRQIAIRGLQEPGAMFQPGPYDIEIDEPVFEPGNWDIEL